MRVNITTNIVVTLVLSKEEAAWLHAVMQNPMTVHSDPSTEHPTDAEMRRKFWDATKPDQQVTP